MGVLPLQFKDGENRESLGLTGADTFDFEGIAGGLEVGKEVTVTATRPDGTSLAFSAIARIDVPIELEYYRHGGVLQYVLRRILGEKE
jgi:aconitate hydratase